MTTFANSPPPLPPDQPLTQQTYSYPELFTNMSFKKKKKKTTMTLKHLFMTEKVSKVSKAALPSSGRQHQSSMKPTTKYKMI